MKSQMMIFVLVGLHAVPTLIMKVDGVGVIYILVLLYTQMKKEEHLNLLRVEAYFIRRY